MQAGLPSGVKENAEDRHLDKILIVYANHETTLKRLQASTHDAENMLAEYQKQLSEARNSLELNKKNYDAIRQKIDALDQGKAVDAEKLLLVLNNKPYKHSKANWTHFHH